MPWKESSQMSSRLEFVMLAQAPDANIRALCRSFQVSPKTAYKWLLRYQLLGAAGLEDYSRRPASSPKRSSSELEARILALHETYPCWGGRKLRALLPDDFPKPHPSTIDAILRRHHRQIQPPVGDAKPALKRFEHEAPNLLWQMDFKGHFALTDARAGRCNPLTVLDDHSRFVVCLSACGNQTRETVQAVLTNTFRRYGLPERITCDNGPPWGSVKKGLSRLEIWLIRLGIRVSHSRPYHPQTQGKDERFHRTLKRELLDRFGFNSISVCQSAFDKWRDCYNLIRPHEALGQKPPVSCYQTSARSFPEVLPAVEYDAGDQVRKVKGNGQFNYKGHAIFLGEGLIGQYIALRQDTVDGIVKLFFCNKELGTLDLRNIH
ncbi:MAG: IS481 family transposase [Burkholderiales bacterium]